jgi:hypothetical protein
VVMSAFLDNLIENRKANLDEVWYGCFATESTLNRTFTFPTFGNT